MEIKPELRSLEVADLTVFLETRADTEGKTPVIEGYAAVFDSETVIDGVFREVIARGAFSRALEEKHDVRALVDHDPSKILARTKANSLQLVEDDRGLKIKFEPPKTTIGADLVENIRNGNLDQMSFAFILKRQSWIEEKDQMPLRRIEDLDLFDVSIVTYPAFDKTSVYLRSRAGVLAEATDLIRKVPIGILKKHLDLLEKGA